MVALAPCPSCQWGDHDGHIAAWRPAPPGVLGGFSCDCAGNCVDRMGPLIADVLRAMMTPISPDAPNNSCIQPTQRKPE